MRTPILICAALCASACATPAQRIANELTKAGLDPARAQCIGGSLQRDLSIAQLQQLGKAARSLHPAGSPTSTVTAADLIRVSSEMTDPAVPIAVARAALACA